MKTAEIISFNEEFIKRKLQKLAKEIHEALETHSKETRTVHKMKTVFKQWIKLHDERRNINERCY